MRLASAVKKYVLWSPKKLAIAVRTAGDILVTGSRIMYIHTPVGFTMLMGSCNYAAMGSCSVAGLYTNSMHNILETVKKLKHEEGLTVSSSDNKYHKECKKTL